MAIGPEVGSCGTALYTGTRVLTNDIATDPLWTDYRQVAAQAGLGACWSEPIRGSRGAVLGAFALYHSQPRVPNKGEIATIMIAAKLAATAIERAQSSEALNEVLEILQSRDSRAGASTRGLEQVLDDAQAALQKRTVGRMDGKPKSQAESPTPTPSQSENSKHGFRRRTT